MNNDEFMLDLDAAPFVPKRWTLISHKEGGRVIVSRQNDLLCLDRKPLKFWLSERQRNGLTIKGADLLCEVANKPTLNANFINFFLQEKDKSKRQSLMPEYRQSQKLLCPGTIFRGANGHTGVMCLRFFNRWWDWFSVWDDQDLDSDCPVVMAASSLLFQVPLGSDGF